jgi:NADH-ubiquinone oxidoreductase chain 3
MITFYLFGRLGLTLLLIGGMILGGIYKGIETDLAHTHPFSCGLESIYLGRPGFSIKFYGIMIVFLIFDIEVCLIFPLIRRTYTLRYIRYFYFAEIYVILMILSVGV